LFEQDDAASATSRAPAFRSASLALIGSRSQGSHEIIRKLKPVLTECADEQVLFHKGFLNPRQPPHGISIQHIFRDVIHSSLQFPLLS
jgi:hypothetical protein